MAWIIVVISYPAGSTSLTHHCFLSVKLSFMTAVVEANSTDGGRFWQPAFSYKICINEHCRARLWDVAKGQKSRQEEINRKTFRFQNLIERQKNFKLNFSTISNSNVSLIKGFLVLQIKYQTM